MLYLKRFFEFIDEITAAVGRRRHYIRAIHAQKQSSRFLGQLESVKIARIPSSSDCPKKVIRLDPGSRRTRWMCCFSNSRACEKRACTRT